MVTELVGIDLGGTKIFGAQVQLDDDGPTVGADTKRATPTTDAGAIVDAVVEVVRDLDAAPAAVGIGTPGVIEPGSGVVEYAPNLAGFDRPVALADAVADRLGAPVVIGNDVNMAALGEVRVGAARGAADVLAVWMGTGLGAGLIIDGELRVGPNGLAGELGHTTVVPDGRVCHCGGRGHLEAYIGRRAMEDRARQLHAAGRTTLLVDLAGDGRMKSKVFATAYRDGDPVACELIDEGLELLAVAVGNVLVTIDVTTVVIGGGLGERLGAIAVDRLGAGLARRRYAGVVPAIVPGTLGDHAGALGAAFHARSVLAG